MKEILNLKQKYRYIFKLKTVDREDLVTDCFNKKKTRLTGLKVNRRFQTIGKVQYIKNTVYYAKRKKETRLKIKNAVNDGCVVEIVNIYIIQSMVNANRTTSDSSQISNKKCW